MSAIPIEPATTPRLRTYAQLVRLPNVFTALADIALGALGLVALKLLPPGGAASFGFLLLASACLYMGGMVWNDYFDVEQDSKERPFRPIPSGRVTRREAARIGGVLLALGILRAAAAGFRDGRMHWLSAEIAVCLAVAILLYDRWLKRFWAGPIGMGACRFLNVLLAFSLAGISGVGIFAASVVGLYIVGVTWFARTEARQSHRGALAAAATVMLLSLLLALPLGLWSPVTPGSSLYLYLLVALGFWVGIPVCHALAHPLPASVQPAVKRSIFGLVLLDATLAVALAGVMGLGILVLLLPALYLGRWVYST
jgi:4-hydroxybenzoate polyprenyltransferase